MHSIYSCMAVVFPNQKETVHWLTYFAKSLLGVEECVYRLSHSVIVCKPSK